MPRADIPFVAPPPDPPRATPPRRGLLGYDRSLEDEIFDLQLQIYPSRNKDLVPRRWRWMFLESATRCGAAPMVWVYRGQTRVVAHQGAIAVRVKVGDTEVVSGWFVETMAAEEVRGKAIGPMVIQKAHTALPFNLSLGQTPEMRALQLVMGWRQVAALETHVYILGQRALANRVPVPGLRHLAAAGARAFQGCTRLRHAGTRRHTLTSAEVSRFGPAHDRLWNTVSVDYTCAVVRDSSYLNWKYVDQPGRDYVRLELCQNGHLVGVVVLLVLEPDRVYPYRRAFLADVVMPLRDEGLVRAALGIVRETCARHGVDAIECELLNGPLSKSMKAFGFLQVAPRRFFLLSTAGSAGPFERTAASPDNWFVIYGDSDLDRPW